MIPYPQGDKPRLALFDNLMQQVQDITWCNLTKLHQAALYPNTCPEGTKALNEFLIRPAKLKDVLSMVIALDAAMPKPDTDDTTLEEALAAVDTMNDDELMEALLRVLDPMLDAGLATLTDVRDLWPVAQEAHTLPAPLPYDDTDTDDDA